jgi:hypothetical protein
MKSSQFARRAMVPCLVLAASLFSFASSTWAQPSPVGEWDYVIAGSHRGNGRITFFSDFTLVGFQIETLPPVKTPSVDPRTGQIEGGTIIGSAGFFGSSVLSGVWSFDVRGRVIGSYVQESFVVEEGTNRPVSLALSFRASVNPQRTTASGSLVGSIIANAQGAGQSVQLRGKPTIPLFDLTGSYYAVSARDNVDYQEFFSLSPTALPNMYDVVGTGPDYSYTGVALFTRTGQFSMATTRDGTNVITSLTGPLRTSSNPPGGTLTGQQTDVRVVKFRINQ